MNLRDLASAKQLRVQLSQLLADKELFSDRLIPGRLHPK